MVKQRSPTFEESELLLLGAIAVKNFEDTMPEYARKLSELDYYFDQFSALPDA